MLENDRTILIALLRLSLQSPMHSLAWLLLLVYSANVLSRPIGVPQSERVLFVGDQTERSRTSKLIDIRGGDGSWWIPSGYHPYGYQITPLGEEFLSFQGSLDCDLGRFLASLKQRKTTYALKTAWLEVVRNSKTGQSMNVYKSIDEMIKYCLKAKLID